MRHLRKAIALLLCLAMCLTLTPVAWAEGPDDEDFLVWEDEPAGEPEPVGEPEVPFEEPAEPAFIFDEDDPEEDTPEADLPDPEEPEETPAQDVEDNASKPVITTQPEDVTAADGTTATFTVAASGSGLSYQWQYRKTANGSWSNSTSASGKTATFTVNAREAINGYQYRCKVSNSAGAVYSSIVTLTVVSVPTITTQPEDITAADGTTATFTVTASGTGLSYQWQYRKTASGSWTNSTSPSGATASFTVNARTAINGYQYRCKVSNSAGIVYSGIATLTVIAKPVITSQPQDVVAADGTQAVFTVAASGTGLSYQWQYRKTSNGSWTNSTSPSGATASFTVNARTAINGYQYRCKVSNSAGIVYSGIATLTVIAKPVITSQPQDIVAADGTQAVFTVAASGTGLSYQWQYRKTSNGSWTNSTSPSGATASFTVNARTAINGYQYRCKVSNSIGTVYSNIVALTVASKPTITTQPKDVTAADGTTATFTVAASGTGLSYQWQYRKTASGSWTNSTSPSGATASFTVNARTAINGYQYRCKVSNSSGTVYSSVATLTIDARPVITTQPKNVTAEDGTTATFTIAANGADLQYQWQYRKTTTGSWTNSTAASGKTAAFTVNARTAINGYQYRCAVSNVAGTVYSDVVTLTVDAKPTITTQPQDVTAADGTTATFTVAVSGTGLSYQWQYRKTANGSWTNSAAASGKTATFTVNARTELNGYQYRCKVSNSAGAVYSSIATLTVASAPTITTQPKDVTAADGTTATFTVAASGTGLSYQWQYRKTTTGSWTNSTAASGKTAAFTVNARTAINGYQYRCKVSNTTGTVYSSIATLTVVSKPAITSQPQDIVAADGTQVVFSIAASGDSLTYQWQYRTSPSGAWKNSSATSGKTAALTVNARFAIDGYQYRCIVKNSVGEVTSEIATLSVGLPINEANFPDANFRAVVSGIDQDENGVLSKSELAVTYLDCTDQNIADLTGIEHFTALRQLSCGNNPLTILDLSANTALRFLECGNTMLTALDLSANTALVSMDCEYCPSLETVVLPEGLGQIGTWAFIQCTALREINIPSSVTSIGYCAFLGCESLNEITLPEGLSSIETCAFKESGLTSIAIPGSVTELTESVFAGCTALESASFGEGLTTIGEAAFDGCTALRTVSLPSTLTTVAYEAFTGCTALESGSFAGTQEQLDAMTIMNGNEDLIRLFYTLPVITAHPASVTVNAGEEASFTVAASGATAYRWQTRTSEDDDWADVSDAAEATLSFTAAVEQNGSQYRCVVSNRAGEVASEAATITVNPAGLAIDETNFPDANFRSYVSSTFDTDEDAHLSEDEIAAVTEINCNGQEISDLTGIEHFTALTSLSCSGNQLTSLDVSSNTALTDLACHSNRLTSLNVSGCTALTEMSCDGNLLTALDVSKNTALTGLYCGHNLLSELDVSSNTALESLLCWANWLTSLNVSGCAALTSLTCSENELTSLDLSGCTALEALECDENALAELDVSGCAALADAILNGSRSDGGSYWEYSKDSAMLRVDKDVFLTPADPRPYLEINEDHFPDENFRRVVSGFDSDGDGWLSQADIATATVMDCSDENIANIEGIAFFTALTTLDCNNNQLMELDLGSSKGLTTLNCSNNMLSSLDLSGNPALTELDCNWNALEDLNISSCSALTKVDCYANRMEQLDLSGCTALRELVCRSCHLTSLTISSKESFTTLDCRNNEITSLSVTDCPALTSVLFTGNELKNLDLSGCTALTRVNFGTSETGGALETANLSGCSALTELSCTERNLVSLDLSDCTSLTAVDCNSNKLTKLNVRGCTALTYLDCAKNQLTSLDVSHNTALMTLHCEVNKLTSLNVSGCTALTTLDCSSNQLTILDVSNCPELTDADIECDEGVTIIRN